MDVEDLRCLAVRDAVPVLEYAALTKPTTPPIDRIPVEILCEIFKHYAHDVIHTPPPILADEVRIPSSQEYAYTWTKVIKVCRRWHDAALSCPGLWSDIVVTHSQWIAKVLARTGQTPLNVLAGLSYNPKGIDALKLVLQEMNRVFSLCISLPPGLVPDLAEHLRNLPPSLVSLELTWGNWYETSNLPLVDVSDIYLHSQSPHLRHISITNVPFMDWTSSILCPTVITLSWKKPRGMGGKKIRMSVILAAFKAMPLLESAELENVIANEIEQDSVPGPGVVKLPHLRTLKIHGDYLTPEMCTSLLHNLSLPALLSLHLSCYPTETVSYILAPFSALLQNQSRIHALSIKLSGYSLQIHAWTSPGAERHLSDVSSASEFFIDDAYGLTGPGDLKPNISLVMNLRDVYNLGTRILLGFCKNMPLSDVKALRVHTRVLSHKQWRELFAMLDGIAFLQIQNFPAPALLQALYSRRARPDENVTDRLVMSGLHTLQFDDCSLSDVYAHEGEGQEDAMTYLLFILDHRRAGGSQLQRLILQRCSVTTSAQLDAARAIIGEVDCTNVQTMKQDKGGDDDEFDVAFKDGQRQVDTYSHIDFGSLA
ncbi:hypothetical protein CERSUDRAFT_114524 [Gelatoporia subvermispora B]|uniref:Uncharacterized protein n=1 Tax=Ceriporiopsis subvermispora (strain B) TaxID=914234 RepID=M2QLI2_CERS8|nr:hypothetical protein CERSUDRAFT_114524 [Gelatoporia subvermispora B]